MRFYAYPPKEIDYPYILRNINQKSVHSNIFHEIVDIGINDLIKSNNHKHSDEKLKKWQELCFTNNSDWKVVPDCPDLAREFKIDVNFDNQEYTKELTLEYFNPGNPIHLPVIQGLYHDPKSVYKYCKWFKREYPNFNRRFGLGTMCRANNKAIVIKSCHIIRKEFPNAWLHGFGMRLHHVADLINIIDSFDSSAWTFPRGRGKGSAKNKSQRIEYFFNYLTNVK